MAPTTQFQKTLVFFESGKMPYTVRVSLDFLFFGQEHCESVTSVLNIFGLEHCESATSFLRVSPALYSLVLHCNIKFYKLLRSFSSLTSQYNETVTKDGQINGHSLFLPGLASSSLKDPSLKCEKNRWPIPSAVAAAKVSGQRPQ